MAYRRDSQKAQEWRKWLQKNKPALDKCGLPESVLEDEMSWLGFLEHGFYDHYKDRNQFRLEDLSANQLKALYAFLDAELSVIEKASAIAFRLTKSLIDESS